MSNQETNTDRCLPLENDQTRARWYGAAYPMALSRPHATQFGSRHVFALMAFLGLSVVYMMRVNISVAIVDMVRMQPSHSLDVNGTTRQSPTSHFCPIKNPGPPSEFVVDGEFDWDGKTQGIVLGSFFWGYAITQLPGGILARKLEGGKLVFGVGVLFTGIFSLVTPLAARYSTDSLIAVRILMGLSEGVTLPAMHHMLSCWVPVQERSTIGAFVLAGTQFGTVIAFPMSGFLCDVNLDGGWPLVFYVPGILAIVWYALWSWAVYDNPQVHPFISDGEKQFIQASIGDGKTPSLSSTPWLDMATSLPVWAILMAHFGKSWGFSILLTELPTYMKTVLHFDLKANSLLSAMPYIAMGVFSILFSLTADALRNNNILDTTQVRKLFNTIGFMAPAFALVGASFTGCNETATVTLITIATGFVGAVYSGFEVNHIDVAPAHAGILMGITNTVASTCGFIAPYVISLIVTNPGSIVQWRIVFLFSAFVYTATNLFYVVFATGEEQAWNCSERGPNEDSKTPLTLTTRSSYSRKSIHY